MNRRRKTTTTTARGEPGSGNVFADLVLPDAEELELKAKLASRIRAVVGDRKFSGAEVRRSPGCRRPTPLICFGGFLSALARNA